MVFGTPISWFINEVIAVALFCIVTVHILKGKDPVHRLLELFFYMLTAGIFENIGVWQHIYDYSTWRIMMFGKVPIAILLVEGVILYATVELMEKVHVPGWVLPFGCGVLSSVQDMTLDPASVFDLHEIEGELEGQWNWTAHYEGGFVDIPFFNFSGWLTMMLFFMAFCMIGRNVYRKKKKEWIGYAYPVFAMLGTLILQCTVNMFLLFMAPLFPMYQKTPELIMLVVNFAVCIFLVLKYSCTSMLTELRLQHELILVQQLRPVIRSDLHSIWRKLTSSTKRQSLLSQTNSRRIIKTECNPGGYDFPGFLFISLVLFHIRKDAFYENTANNSKMSG